MGINYYAVKKKPSVQSNSHIHICKLSFGWLPLFQKSEHFNTYTQLKTWLNDNTNTSKCEYVILDEYDRTIKYDDLIKMIEEHQNNPKNKENIDNFRYCDNVDGYRFQKNYFS